MTPRQGSEGKDKPHNVEPIPRRLLDKDETAIYTGLRNARAVDERRKQDPTFPKARMLSPRALRWRPEDLDTWIASLPTEDSEPAPAFELKLAADVRKAA
jgi:predicted DNA-binding transcriptional regulator AlpA